jgi:hypothetical protein
MKCVQCGREKSIYNKSDLCNACKVAKIKERNNGYLFSEACDDFKCSSRTTVGFNQVTMDYQGGYVRS